MQTCRALPADPSHAPTLGPSSSSSFPTATVGAIAALLVTNATTRSYCKTSSFTACVGISLSPPTLEDLGTPDRNAGDSGRGS
jgi:hypothetical protein